ncbi:uncharacterized protein LOC133824508 [Humulus lupulus]|uniref:uncharacterized protein LOC133824508 n=1 Tax=Humulus lupulus TaxID=3486 RepID=UPI002B41814A|nr:uncharacterized protein LOC133824508 [Humulus lupulus]
MMFEEEGKVEEKVIENLEKKQSQISIDHHIKIPYPQRQQKNKLDKKLEEYEIVALTEDCSAILQKKLPPKLKDSGSFIIPYTIGNVVFEKALCDLGVSVNLMPLAIYRKLKLGEACPTTMSLQMADHSIKYPCGVINDVLVKVDKFIFPADFIILDIEEDKNIMIILGRPF